MSRRTNALALLGVLLAIHVTPTLQFTHYANQNATAVVTSVSPCHLYGDSDSYGIGVRISLYLQFFAGLLVRMAGLQKDLKTIRLGCNIVATSTMINTYNSTHDGSFAYLEWYLVTLLVLTLPLFVVSPFSMIFSAYQGQESIKRSWITPNDGDNITENKNMGSEEHVRTPETGLPDASSEEDLLDDPLGIGWSLLLFSFSAGTQVWLYFFGLYRGHRPECTAKVFIYADVNMYNHHWVTFLKVVAISEIICAPFALLWAVSLIGFGIFKSTRGQGSAKGKTNLTGQPKIGPDNALVIRNENRENQEQTTNTGERSGVIRNSGDFANIWTDLAEIADDYDRRSRPIRTAYFAKWFWRLLLIVQALFGGGLAIVWIERTIIINNIDLSGSPVYSSSQLSALLVGIFTALPAAWKSAWELIRERKKLKKDLAELRDEVISAHDQRQFERQERERIREEKERREKERLEAERAAGNQGPSVISQTPRTYPWVTLAGRMPNWMSTWRVSIPDNPESRAENGGDVDAVRGQDRTRGP